MPDHNNLRKVLRAATTDSVVCYRNNNENRTLFAMTRKRTGPGGSSGLDEVSKAIIEQLQQDGRRSYASIGKAVGLSEAAVRQRVQEEK